MSIVQSGLVLMNKICYMRYEGMGLRAALMAVRVRQHLFVSRFLLPAQVPCCP